MRVRSSKFFPNNLLQVDILGLVPSNIRQKSEITSDSRQKTLCVGLLVLLFEEAGNWGVHRAETSQIPATLSTLMVTLMIKMY